MVDTEISLEDIIQTVTVGQTTTGEPGTNAEVVNSGTGANPVLDFTIPRGQPGAPGPANTLTIGTVTDGEQASASITGEAPNQTLNLTLPKGEQGEPGQNAVNPFKGWFNSLAELKAAYTAVEGDSAYVKDASPATTWSIYVYDSTASSDNYWADSGTDADTSNVQTFASGEEVNETPIDNTHLANPADGALPTAEDVLQLKAKLEGVTASETKVTSLTDYKINNQSGYYSTLGNWVGNTNGYYSYRIDVSSAKRVRFLGYATNNTTVCYAFLKSDGTTFIDGYPKPYIDTSLSVAELREYIIDIPSEAKYLMCLYKNGNSGLLQPTNFYCYLQSGDTVIDMIPEVENLSAATPTDKNTLSFESIIDLHNSSLQENNVSLANIIEHKGSIKRADGQYSDVTSNNYKFKVVPLNGATLVELSSINYSTSIAFLKSFDPSYTSGTDSTAIAFSSSLYKEAVANGIKILFTVPISATYLWIQTTYGGNDVSPSSVKIITDKREISTKHISLSGGSLNGSTGLYPAGLANYLGHAHTPQFIKIVGTATIKTANTRGYVLYYDLDQVFKGSKFFANTNGDYVINDEYELGTYYVRVAFNTNEGAKIPPFEQGVEFEGYFEDDFLSFQKQTQTHYQPLTFFVNVNKCNVEKQSPSNIDTQYNVSTDSGMLHLPSSYNEKGEPTPLIIYLHGASDKYTSSDTEFAGNNPYAPEWDAAGYAQLDLDMIPDLYNYTATGSGGSGDDYECIVGAYQWCISHFNIARNGVYLFGRSRGAQAVMQVLGHYDAKRLPVICALSNAGANTIINYELFAESSSAQWNLFCESYGLPSTGRPSFGTGTSPLIQHADIATFLRNNIEIWFDKAMTAMPLIVEFPQQLNTKLAIFDMLVNAYNVSENKGADFYNFIRSCKVRNLIPLRFDWCVGDTTQQWGTVDNYARACKDMFVNSLSGNAIYVEWPDAPNNQPVGSSVSNPHFHELMNFYDGNVTLGNGTVVENPSMARLEWLLWAQRYDRRCVGLQNAVFTPNI